MDFIGNIPSLAAELVRRTAALAADTSDADMDDDAAEELDVVEMDRGTPQPATSVEVRAHDGGAVRGPSTRALSERRAEPQTP